MFSTTGCIVILQLHYAIKYNGDKAPPLNNRCVGGEKVTARPATSASTRGTTSLPARDPGEHKQVEKRRISAAKINDGWKKDCSRKLLLWNKRPRTLFNAQTSVKIKYLTYLLGYAHPIFYLPHFINTIFAVYHQFNTNPEVCFISKVPTAEVNVSLFLTVLILGPNL